MKTPIKKSIKIKACLLMSVLVLTLTNCTHAGTKSNNDNAINATNSDSANKTNKPSGQNNKRAVVGYKAKKSHKHPKADTITINVKDAGAKGDGTTDDYAAITKALSQGTQPAKIYFPAGNYLITKSLSTTHDGTVLSFDKGAKLIIDNSNLEGGILLKNNSCSVIGAYIQGNNISSKAMVRGFGIELLGVSDCKVLNCTLYQIGGPSIFLYSKGNAGCHQCLIDGNIITEPAFDRKINQDAPGIMVGYSGNGYFHTNITISHNTVDGNEKIAHGIAMIGHAHDVLIANNNVKNCLRYGIITYNSIYTVMTVKNMNVIHNVVDNIGDRSKPNPYGMGIYIMESHYSIIRGNKVTNTLINTDNSELLPPGAISLNGSIECVVDSNTVQVSHKYGIMIDEGFNTTVTNNIIDNTGMSGIYLSNTSGNMVSGNTLTHIKDYAVKGFFVHTSRKGFDNLNIDQYKNSPTGQNITITNNNFSTSRTDRAIYMMGDQPNPSTNYVGNQIQNIKVFNNTIHMQNHSPDFVHFEREVGGTNSAHDNNVVQ